MPALQKNAPTLVMFMKKWTLEEWTKKLKRLQNGNNI
jgi:hypothetical protein